jgi:hypothetical protein
VRFTLLIVAPVLGLSAACSRAPVPPSAPPLVAFDAPDARCQARGGGSGVDLGGTCLPIVMRAGGSDHDAPAPAPAADPRIAAAAARLSAGDDCTPSPGAVTGDDAVFMHVVCTDVNRERVGYVVRVDSAGNVLSVAVPKAAAGRVTFVPGARPLIAAVLCNVGTMVFDARTLAGRAGWARMGGWANAASDGAAASPDGAWLAVPDPYGERIDLVRTADLTVVASPRVRDLAARDEGPGRIAWSGAALEITTFRLPYE